MHKDELRQLLTDFTAERLAILQRHEASAPRRQPLRFQQHLPVRDRARRDPHHVGPERAGRVRRRAAGAGGGAVRAGGAEGQEAAAVRVQPILEEDARTLRAFVDRWRPHVDAMTHARHRTMLNVVLGESLEHMRLFEQGAAGDEDLLGRRTSLAERVGAVLPHRWME